MKFVGDGTLLKMVSDFQSPGRNVDCRDGWLLAKLVTVERPCPCSPLCRNLEQSIGAIGTK